MHDLLSKIWTDRRLVYSAKGRIFNNTLYVRYVHLAQAKINRKRQTHSLVIEDIT
jgi:hypothetical protein